MKELQRMARGRRIKGRIREDIGEFIVEEISKVPKIEEGGEYTYFYLRKKGWATSAALMEISGRCNVPASRFSAAGHKDRVGETKQLVSAWNIPPAKLLGLKLPQTIGIEVIGKGNEKVGIGKLIGNRFKVRVRGISNGEKAVKMAGKIAGELDCAFPNYFGPQRFGMQGRETHKIGELMLKARMEDAVMRYLCAAGNMESKSIVQARKELLESQDYMKALGEFPKSFRYERILLEHLSKKPHDYVGAFMKLPRAVLLLFVHAYQSYIFNMHLSHRIGIGEIMPRHMKEGEKVFKTGEDGFIDEKSGKNKEWLALQLPGYNSKLSEFELELLEQDGIRLSDFRMRHMPKLSSEGKWRPALAPFLDFSFDGEWFSFSLGKGCYATSLMREFVEFEG